MRFQIAYGRIAVLLKALGLPERDSYVFVDDEMLTASFGWAFQADIARASVAQVKLHDRKHISIGAHGWRGKWLVNGKAGDFVRLEIKPPSSAKVGPMPIHLRQLTVSLEDRERFVELLSQAQLR